jgi:hypothetical protein
LHEVIERLSRRVTELSSRWTVLIAALIFLVFMLRVLPDQAARAQSYSEGIGSPDTNLLTTPAELYQIAEGYGAVGRRQYIQARWTFDVLFPLTYGTFFLTAISYSFSRLWPANSRAQKFALLAIAAVLSDLLENSAMMALMALYPLEIPALAYLAVALSALKWLLVGSSMVLALGGLIFVSLRALFRLFKRAS